MVESLFVDDLKERGVEVQRNTAFVDYEDTPRKVRPIQVITKMNVDQTGRTLGTRYLVGCDGSHSQVRKALPNSRPLGVSRDALWGVLDGVVDTDFPDIWGKTIISSEEYGSILILPRERNITRLYIEMRADTTDGSPSEDVSEEFVVKRAKAILEPYSISWRRIGTSSLCLCSGVVINRGIEWFGRYKIGQRVASHFTDPDHRVFIGGDVSSM